MKYVKKYLAVMFMLLSYMISFASPEYRVDSLLTELDKAIKDRPLYVSNKEKTIKSIIDGIERAHSDKEKFEMLGYLLEEVRPFNSDSAFNVVKARMTLAEKMGNPKYRMVSDMELAEILGTSGMYSEAMEILSSIRRCDVPEEFLPFYYHIYRTVYGYMADYSVWQPSKDEYQRKTGLYRDSLIMVNESTPSVWTLVLSDRYNVEGKYEEAVKLLTDYLENEVYDMHDVAIYAYTLSESYKLMGDMDKYKEYLIISAIADMKAAVREYVSLRKLAVILFYEGDIERAYEYVNLCMEDAEDCNANLRKLEILDIFPIINSAYQNKIENQKDYLVLTVCFIGLLTLLLAVAILHVYKQKSNVDAARKEVEEANERLKKLNEELCRTNESLVVANRSIAENTYLKEEYIGRYMDQCSVYLEKLDKYRRYLRKLISMGNSKELYETIKSSEFVEKDRQEFYENFDSSFLRLFPTFVEDFNALLSEGNKIVLKSSERLNTELRIYALIRLGITDSVKIAQFLRYSVTTIYNYRTKLRNKAAGNRAEFEDEVMKIGTTFFLR